MISKITIGFSRPKSKFAIGSWLIRKYMGTPYSHVYIRFYSESINRTLIYEAVGHGGVRFVGYNLWNTHAQEIEHKTLDVKKCNSISLLQFCVDMAGISYGWKQNLGIVFASIFGWKSNPWKKGKNCSEAVADFLHMEGYNFNKAHDLVTPKDIYDVLFNPAV